MEEKASAQLRVIHLVVDALRVAGCSAWLFGGWGMDARIGRITRVLAAQTDSGRRPPSGGREAGRA